MWYSGAWGKLISKKTKLQILCQTSSKKTQIENLFRFKTLKTLETSFLLFQRAGFFSLTTVPIVE